MNTIVIPMLRPEAPAILAGRLDGKRSLTRSLEALPHVTDPTLVVLDFRGVDLATSSFLDEGVVRLRDHLRLGSAPTYLMVANLNDTVEEELNDLLMRSSDALGACVISTAGEISDKKLLGALEPKLHETLELVKGGATAMQLHGHSEEAKKIVPTAWNNRLSKLAAKSLVVEEQQPGRTKRYLPIMEAV